MRRRLAALLLGSALLAWSGDDLRAQPVPLVDVTELPADPAFDMYIDLDLLADAWEDKNAPLLTDLGLAMAEGERILQRPRRGLTAADVFSGAIKTAAELKNQ